MASGALLATYNGHVATARDALKLFEACLQGRLNHVPRRPHDRERTSLIKSGSIFIYEENASGIKRWTDGVPWSPSRILGNFLIYRELSKPFPPGEKKRAQKRPKNNNRAARTADPYPTQRRSSEDGTYSGSVGTAQDTDVEGRETERQLIGSLVDSYGFKHGGLVKKTMSVNVHGIHHHMVSYYTVDDVLSGRLRTPADDKTLDDIMPREQLIHKQNFRAPIDELDISVGGQDSMGPLNPPYNGYTYYDRPPPMMGHMPQQPNSHMSMSMYPTPGYSTASSAGPTYSAASAPTSYYQTATTMSYTQPYPPATHAPLPMVEPHSNYGYAPPHRGSYSGQMPSRMGSMESITPTSDGKASDSYHGHSGSYSSSYASPISAQSAYGQPPAQWPAPPLAPRDPWGGYGAPPNGMHKSGTHMPAHSAAEQSYRPNAVPVS